MILRCFKIKVRLFEDWGQDFDELFWRLRSRLIFYGPGVFLPRSKALFEVRVRFLKIKSTLFWFPALFYNHGALLSPSKLFRRPLSIEPFYFFSVTFNLRQTFYFLRSFAHYQKINPHSLTKIKKKNLKKRSRSSPTQSSRQPLPLNLLYNLF